MWHHHHSIWNRVDSDWHPDLCALCAAHGDNDSNEGLLFDCSDSCEEHTHSEGFFGLSSVSTTKGRGARSIKRWKAKTVNTCCVWGCKTAPVTSAPYRRTQINFFPFARVCWRGCPDCRSGCCGLDYHLRIVGLRRRGNVTA